MNTMFSSTWENSRHAKTLVKWVIPGVLAAAAGYIVYKLTDDKDDDIVMLQNALESDISRHDGNGPYSGVGRTWQEGGSMLSDFPSLTNNNSNNDSSYVSGNGVVAASSTNAVGDTVGIGNGNKGGGNLAKDAAFEELHSIVEVLNLQSTAVQTLEQAITTAVTKISLLETSSTPPFWARDLARSISVMRDDIASIKESLLAQKAGGEYSLGDESSGSGVSYYDKRRDSILITDIDNVKVEDKAYHSAQGHSHHSHNQNNKGTDEFSNKSFESPKRLEGGSKTYSPFNSEFASNGATSSSATVINSLDDTVATRDTSVSLSADPQSPKQTPKNTPTKEYYANNASSTATTPKRQNSVAKKGETEFLENIYAQTLLMIELARFKSKVKFDVCLIGIAAIIIYVSNVVDNPDTPRYKRISTNNNNYKMVLMPLPGHELVLESLGYQRHGAAFDHVWKLPSKSKLDSSPIKNNTQAAADAPDENMALSVLSTAMQFLRDIQQSDSYDGAIATIAVHQSVAGI